MFNRNSVQSLLWMTALTFVLSTDSLAQAPSPKLQQARTLIQQNDLPAAEALLHSLTADEPKNGAAWYWLGYSLHAQGKLEAALVAHRKAAEFTAHKPDALFNAACVHARLGDADAAFEALTQAVAAGFADRVQMETDSDLADLRTDPRFDQVLPPLLADEDLFAEEVTVLHTFVGEAANSEFGWVARKTGDLDGDGVIDFVTTAPSFQSGAGKAYVYSSQDGLLLFTRVGQPGERLGNGAAGAGDVNRDGTPDVILGAPGGIPLGGPGHAYVLSGKDGSLLHDFTAGESGDSFGYKVCGLGDLDGDEHSDVLVTAISGTGQSKGTGRCCAYSGKTGQPLFTLDGQEPNGKFGSAAAGSMNPQQLLLAIGAQSEGPRKRGRVHVYALGPQGAQPRFTIESDAGSATLGMMFVAFPGDLNGDGLEDVYASDFNDSTGGRGAGRVVVHSGQDGSRLLNLIGTQPGEGFGTSVSDAGDVNGDGLGDLVVGAWQNAEGAPSGGKIYLHDGRDGALLDTWTCLQAGDTLGFDSTGLGDVDGDGLVDFLFTSAWSPARGPKTGRVLILAGREYAGQD